MAKFNIEEGSVDLVGKEKTCMRVKFVSENAETEYMYHEVESVDKDEVEAQLQLSADEWEKAVATPAPEAPALETGKDIQSQPKD